jgi:hypothetical protein
LHSTERLPGPVIAIGVPRTSPHRATALPTEEAYHVLARRSWLPQDRLYRSRHELVFVFKHGRSGHRNNVQLGQFGRNRSNVWHYPGANSFARHSEEGNLLALHPTVKPVAMVADAILDCSARGEIVLDAFLGSGTTVIAAERTGRRCHGLELDPIHVDRTVRRWQKLTGGRARHAASDRDFDDLAREAEVAHAA